AGFAKVPAVETRLDLPVQHPRYLTIPKVGMAAAPALMARSLRPRVRRLCDEARIQLIDSHFLYPDGVAAWRLGREIGVPVLMTARGSDINLFRRFREPRRQILEAARGCARVITVSDALRDALIGPGVAPSRVVTLRNGV